MVGLYETYLNPDPIIERRSYKLTLVTALAAHGNKAKEEAQFLPSSIKGVYHYWFRALNGIDKSEGALRVAEANLFGSTSVKDQKKKSPVTFGTAVPSGTSAKNKVPILYHKSGGTTPAFRESTIVELSITALRKHQSHLDYMDGLTQVILQLGGFGLRSRRGLGSCQLEDAEFTDVDAFSTVLQNNLQNLQLSGLYSFHPGAQHLLSIKNEAQIPFQQPVLLNVWIGKAYENPKAILEAIGKASHEAKKGGGNLGDSKPRQASPLHVTVRKIGGKYYPVLSEVSAKNIRSRYQPALKIFLKHMGVERNGQ